MKQVFVITCVILFSVQADSAFGQPAVEKPPEYVGEVIIVGNTVTQDRVIRAVLQDFIPGQTLKRAKLPAAEKALASLGLFKVDPVKKTGPTVQVLETKGPFKDILVKVEESKTRSWKVAAVADSMGRPVVRLVMEDRNFDPLRWPTSMADIHEDRAFRGRGQKVCMEVVRINILDGRIEFFSKGLVVPVLIRPLFEK